MILIALGIGLSACTAIGDNMGAVFFTDPAMYDLYDCKALEKVRATLALRLAEIQALRTKAETGVAGSVVAEAAYGNDYIATRGQSDLAEKAWRQNTNDTVPGTQKQ
jgi:hypothetical protein